MYTPCRSYTKYTKKSKPPLMTNGLLYGSILKSQTLFLELLLSLTGLTSVIIQFNVIIAIIYSIFQGLTYRN